MFLFEIIEWRLNPRLGAFRKKGGRPKNAKNRAKGKELSPEEQEAKRQRIKETNANYRAREKEKKEMLALENEEKKKRILELKKCLHAAEMREAALKTCNRRLTTRNCNLDKQIAFLKKRIAFLEKQNRLLKHDRGLEASDPQL